MISDINIENAYIDCVRQTKNTICRTPLRNIPQNLRLIHRQIYTPARTQASPMPPGFD